jgi:hypothetical protein
MAEILATLDEVAAELRVTSRWLRKVVKDRAVPVLRKGRIIRFDALARAALQEALRQPCPSRSSDEKTPGRSPSPAPSSYRMGRGSAFDRALALTTSGSPKKKLARSKPVSCETPTMANVVALDRFPKP